MTSEPCAGSLQALLNYWMPMHTSLVLGSVGRRLEKLMEDDTPRKRGRPFAPGNHFGKGRKAGSRNKATLAPGQLPGRGGAQAVLAPSGDYLAILAWGSAVQGRRSASKALVQSF